MSQPRRSLGSKSSCLHLNRKLQLSDLQSCYVHAQRWSPSLVCGASDPGSAGACSSRGSARSCYPSPATPAPRPSRKHRHTAWLGALLGGLAPACEVAAAAAEHTSKNLHYSPRQGARVAPCAGTLPLHASVALRQFSSGSVTGEALRLCHRVWFGRARKPTRATLSLWRTMRRSRRPSGGPRPACCRCLHC